MDNLSIHLCLPNSLKWFIVLFTYSLLSLLMTLSFITLHPLLLSLAFFAILIMCNPLRSTVEPLISTKDVSGNVMDDCEEWEATWMHPTVSCSKKELNSNLLSALSIQCFKSRSYIISIAFFLEENSQPLHVLFFFLLLWLDHFMCNLFWGLIYTSKLKGCCWLCMIWAHYQSHWTSYSVRSLSPLLSCQ